MLLKKRLKRKSINISSNDRVYSWGALSVTIELKDFVNDCSYHVTMTKQDLEKYLAKITDRENEIKRLNDTCECCEGRGYLEVTYEDNCEYIEACEECDYFGMMGTNDELNERAREKARAEGVKMTKQGKVK